MPYPFVGKTVHHVASTEGAYPSTCRAAIVTNVLEMEDELIPPGTYVNLLQLNDEGVTAVPVVRFSEELPHAAGTWHEVEPVSY